MEKLSGLNRNSFIPKTIKPREQEGREPASKEAFAAHDQQGWEKVPFMQVTYTVQPERMILKDTSTLDDIEKGAALDQHQVNVGRFRNVVQIGLQTTLVASDNLFFTQNMHRNTAQLVHQFLREGKLEVQIYSPTHDCDSRELHLRAAALTSQISAIQAQLESVDIRLSELGAGATESKEGDLSDSIETERSQLLAQQTHMSTTLAKLQAALESLAGEPPSKRAVFSGDDYGDKRDRVEIFSKEMVGGTNALAEGSHIYKNKKVVIVNNSREGLSELELRDTLTHEIQHAVDLVSRGELMATTFSERLSFAFSKFRMMWQRDEFGSAATPAMKETVHLSQFLPEVDEDTTIDTEFVNEKQKNIFLHLMREEPDIARLYFQNPESRAIIHEQKDPFNHTVFDWAGSEFRAYWIEDGEGNKFPFAEGVPEPVQLNMADFFPNHPEELIVTDFQTKRQQGIFLHIFRHYSEIAREYLKNKTFRDKVQSMIQPQGVNLINSVRVMEVLELMHQFGVLSTDGKSDRAGHVLLNITTLYGGMKFDELDKAFLRSDASAPFWGIARHLIGEENVQSLQAMLI